MRLSKASFAAGAAAAIVLGSGTAFAATGGNFLLGKSNTAGATTTLSNANGTALSLISKSGYASLKVNRTTKVTNLNSDLLDGKDWTSGQVGTIVDYGYYIDLQATFENPAGDGVPDFVAATVSCPPGTKLMGGGGVDGTPNGSLWYNAPNGPGTWVVASTWTPVKDPQTDAFPEPENLLNAYAQCYNPVGPVLGDAYPRTSTRSTDDMLRSAIARKAN
jgi:hypothetical protein